jgi:hypothetical protein
MSTIDTATGGYLNDGRGDSISNNGGHCDLNGNCGTGYGEVTFPGDPNLNDSGLTAMATYVGVTLNWIVPARSYAVAHVKVYRSTSAVAATAANIGQVSGSYYFDPVENLQVGTRYYYWIRMVSINGTVGELIGPANAVVRGTVDQILDGMNGEINELLLTATLREKIDNIGVLASTIDREISDRLGFSDVLDQLYAGLQGQLEAQGTLIYQKESERKTDDQALAVQISGLGANLDGQIGLIKNEQLAVINRVAGTEGLYSGLVSVTNQLDLKINGQEGSIQEAKTLATNALGNIEAQYYLKVEANGAIGGFGLGTEGGKSAFIVNADKFAITTPGSTVTPFVVSGNKVGINTAVIGSAAIKMANIERYIQSSGFSGSTPGWRLDQAGGFELRGAGGKVLLKTTSSGSTSWDDAVDNGSIGDIDFDQWQPTIGWTFNQRQKRGWASLNHGTFYSQANATEVSKPTRSDAYWYTNISPNFVPSGESVQARLRFFGSASDWRGVCRYVDSSGLHRVTAPFPGSGSYKTVTWNTNFNGPVKQIGFEFFSRAGSLYCRTESVSIGKPGSGVTQIDSNNIGIYMADATIDRAQIKDLAVDTLKIKDNAVTVPRVWNLDYGANPPILAGNEVHTRIMYVGQNWGPASTRPKDVQLSCTANFKPNGNGGYSESSIRLGIQVDAGGIYWFSQNTQEGFPGSVNLVYSHRPGTYHTYAIWATTSRYQRWGVNRMTLTAIGAKK